MQITVTVYPAYNENFIEIIPGVCDTIGKVETTCDNYVISGNGTLPQPGPPGSDTWTIRYNGKQCFNTINIEVPYGCEAQCPTTPQIDIGAAEHFCSGSDIEIACSYDNTDANADATFNLILKDAGIEETIISELNDGDNYTYTLPVYNGCEPKNITIKAEVICKTGVPIAGLDLVKTITLYPDFNPDFINTSVGVCDTAAAISTICSRYIIPQINPTIPSPDNDNGTDSWIVSYDYKGGNVPSNCFNDTIVEVVYTCGRICPSEPALSITEQNVCGKTAITLNGAFGQEPDLTGTFQIREKNNLIDAASIQEGQAFELPENVSCDPVKYTFTANATCDSGEVIPVSNTDDMTIVVTVYPAYNENFVNIIRGVCDTAGQVKVSCTNYILTPPTTPTIPGIDQSGVDEWMIAYNNPDACFEPITLQVPYGCGVTCPSQPSISISQTTACGGDLVTIDGVFGEEGDVEGAFNIVEEKETITNITRGQAFTVPENTDCDPKVLTFIANPTCSTGEEIEGLANQITRTLTVYPSLNQEVLLRIQEGDCDRPTSVAAVCDNYSVETVRGPTTPKSGESGVDEYLVTYVSDDGVSCFSETINVYFACGATCPQGPKITASNAFACSGDEITIFGSFEQQNDDNLTANFVIEETSNELTNISIDEGILIPENKNCDPRTYTFRASVFCANGDSISGISENLTTTVKVYPEFDQSLIQVQAGGCGQAGIITVGCPNYEANIQGTATIPEPGDEGEDSWVVNYIPQEEEASTCFDPIRIEVPYKCSASCPSEPVLSAERTYLCSGNQGRLVGTFLQEGNSEFDGFFEIEEADNRVADIQNGIPFDLPQNKGCDPITYRFDATVLCENGEPIGSTETIEIIVFPRIDLSLIDIIPGTCSDLSEATSTCDNYTLTPPNNHSPAADGEFTYDNWIVTYDTGTDDVNCEDFTEVIEVPKSCNLDCPSEPYIKVEQTNICSGDLLFIEAGFLVQGNLMEDFQIVLREREGKLSNIPINQEMDFPANNTCEPQYYLLEISRASCANNQPIPVRDNGQNSIEIVVWPDYNEDLVEIIAGDCDNLGRVESICPYKFEPIERPPSLALSGTFGYDKWVVNYDASNAPAEVCFNNIRLSVPKRCDVDCPQEPIIDIEDNKESMCSGDLIIVNGRFNIPGSIINIGGRFEITATNNETGEVIDNLIEGEPFTIRNTECDPIEYTIEAKAYCGDLSEIEGNNLSQTIKVYPEYNADLVSVKSYGDCANRGEAQAICPNYILTPPREAEQQPIEEGDIGADAWLVAYNDDNGCFNSEIFSVTYRCGTNCPAEPRVNVSLLNGGNKGANNEIYLCGGESIDFNYDFNIQGTQGISGKVQLFDTERSTAYNNGEIITFPEHNGCDPQIYTLDPIAICDSGDTIPTTIRDVVVYVFPTDIDLDKVTITEGTCGNAGSISIQGDDCDRYIAKPRGSATVPEKGQSGADAWEILYNPQGLGKNCVQQSVYTNVYYECDVEPPVNPYVNRVTDVICSADVLQISPFFEELGEGFGLTKHFIITEESNTIDTLKLEILGWQADTTSITFPPNESCMPVDYKFFAQAFYAKRGEEAQVIGDLITFTTTVYPQPSRDLVFKRDGCTLEVNQACEADDLRIEYFNEALGEWDTVVPNRFPLNQELVEWRAFYEGAPEGCYATKIDTAMNCPRVEDGCPYPVVVAKRGTVDPSDPDDPRPASLYGPVVLFCHLPPSLNTRPDGTLVDLNDVEYTWGFRTNDNRSFIVPGEACYRITEDGLLEDRDESSICLENYDRANVHEPFFVVNPANPVNSLAQYGVLVNTRADCPTLLDVIYYSGKVEGELPTDIQPQIYPNPNNGQFQLLLPKSAYKGKVQINMYNYQGQHIDQATFDKQGMILEQTINIPHQKDGLYFIHIQLEDGRTFVEPVMVY